LGLVLCALALGAAGATASAAPLSSATDPSAAGGELAWQQLGGAGALRNAAGAISVLPGDHPALGGERIAWAGAVAITVADRASLTPAMTIAATGVNALAVSDAWLVAREQDASGAERLVGISLTAPAQSRYIYGARLPGEVGRPSLDGARVVFAVGTPVRSAILSEDLATGRMRTLRVARRGAALANPSLRGGRLLFERATRCYQQLRIGAAATPRRSRSRDRTLLSLPSTARRDTGYERGYTHAYNEASKCANRPAGRGGAVRLGPTALSAAEAYVTLSSSAASDARIVAIAR
jgi:hypothetical protein